MMLSTRALPDITSSPEVWQVFKIRTVGKPEVFLPEVFSRFFFIVYLKFGFSEKATKFEKIFHVKFNVTEYHQILRGRFFQILRPSQNIQTLILTPNLSLGILSYEN